MLLVFGLLILASTTLQAADPSSVRRPNLVLILVDDLGFNDCWLSQCDLSRAWPHVSKMASEGIVIESFYTSSLCTPTRGALMTGRYPSSLGLHHGVITGFRDYGLPLNETTLAEKLRTAGYQTHAVGKWHLGGYSDASTPLARGFDSTFGYLNGEEDHYTHSVENLGDLNDGSDYASPSDRYKGRHGSFVFSEKAVEVVESARAPFFLYYALQNAHYPLQAPESYARSRPCDNIAPDSPNYPNGSRVIFCALAVMADEAIRNVTSKLNATDTLVAVFGDNGGLVSAGGNNWPLRGQKAEPWEGGIRNHAFFWGYGINRHQKTYSKGYVHVVDVHATLVALANASSPNLIDGIDIFDAITHDLPSPRNQFLGMYDPCSRECEDGRCAASAFAYVYDDFKLVKPASHRDGWFPPPQSSHLTTTTLDRRRPGPSGSVLWRDEDDTCVDDVDDTLHLYNLRTDPEERNNLATPNASPWVNEMIRTIYELFLASLGSEMPPCNIPNGSCSQNDPIGEKTCKESGFWKPWVHVSTEEI